MDVGSLDCAMRLLDCEVRELVVGKPRCLEEGKKICKKPAVGAGEEGARFFEKAMSDQWVVAHCEGREGGYKIGHVQSYTE